MLPDFVLPALVGLLPVACFLVALLYLDSYKLVKLNAVIAVVVCGALVAGACYLVNALALDLLGIDFTPFSRYVAPVIEELLKGLVIVAARSAPIESVSSWMPRSSVSPSAPGSHWSRTSTSWI